MAVGRCRCLVSAGSVTMVIDSPEQDRRRWVPPPGRRESLVEFEIPRSEPAGRQGSPSPITVDLALMAPRPATRRQLRRAEKLSSGSEAASLTGDRRLIALIVVGATAATALGVGFAVSERPAAFGTALSAGQVGEFDPDQSQPPQAPLAAPAPAGSLAKRVVAGSVPAADDRAATSATGGSSTTSGGAAASPPRSASPSASLRSTPSPTGLSGPSYFASAAVSASAALSPSSPTSPAVDPFVAHEHPATESTAPAVSSGPTSAGPTTAGPTGPGPTVPGPTSPGPTSPGPTSAGPTSPRPVPSDSKRPRWQQSRNTPDLSSVSPRPSRADRRTP